MAAQASLTKVMAVSMTHRAITCAKVDLSSMEFSGARPGQILRAKDQFVKTPDDALTERKLFSRSIGML